MAVHIQVRRGKHTDNGSGSIYIRLRARQEEQARGAEKDTDFGCKCIGIRRKYRREVQKTQRNLFGNPAWVENCRCTHTHTFYHSWQILGTAHQKGAIKVWCVQSSKWLWPSHQLAATHCARHQLAATHCARRAESRVHRRAACEIKQKIGHRFSISKWPEGSRSVLCPVSNLCTGVSLSSAGWLVLCTRGRSCSLRDHVQIQSIIFQSNSLALQPHKDPSWIWQFSRQKV